MDDSVGLHATLRITACFCYSNLQYMHSHPKITRHLKMMTLTLDNILVFIFTFYPNREAILVVNLHRRCTLWRSWLFFAPRHRRVLLQSKISHSGSCEFVCVCVCLSVHDLQGRSLLPIFFILGILEPSRDGEEAFFLDFLKILIFSIFNNFFYVFFRLKYTKIHCK